MDLLLRIHIHALYAFWLCYCFNLQKGWGVGGWIKVFVEWTAEQSQVLLLPSKGLLFAWAEMSNGSICFSPPITGANLILSLSLSIL